MHCENFLLCQRWDSNRGPLAPKSNTLTTKPCSTRVRLILHWLLIPLLWLFLTNSLWSCQWPRRSLLTSEMSSGTLITYVPVLTLSHCLWKAFFPQNFTPPPSPPTVPKWHVGSWMHYVPTRKKSPNLNLSCHTCLLLPQSLLPPQLFGPQGWWDP